MPVYPGSDPVTVEQTATLDDGSRVTAIRCDSHTGTHVDAPSHMRADGATLEELALDSFTFDARIVDCTDTGPRDPITVEDLRERLAAEGAAELVAIHTGWSDHWGSDDYRDHPYLTGDAAAWCANRGLSVGIDAFSPDPTPSIDAERERPAEPDGFPAHDALLGADCRIVENLTNLDAVPSAFTLHALPLNIPGSDGSPVRAVALTGQDAHRE